MRRNAVICAFASLFALAVIVSSGSPATSGPATAATMAKKQQAAGKRPAAKRHAKRRSARRPARYGPYGFLPGVRPPEVVQLENEWRAWHRPYYAIPWPRFHRGRWNGGGFGDCYTYTPIGPVWNCGR